MKTTNLNRWLNGVGIVFLCAFAVFVAHEDHNWWHGVIAFAMFAGIGIGLSITSAAVDVLISRKVMDNSLIFAQPSPDHPDREAILEAQQAMTRPAITPRAVLASRLWLTSIAAIALAWAVGRLMLAVVGDQDYTYPHALLTKDYGNQWPKGEIDRIRETECVGGNVPFLTVKKDGQYLSCGTWPWSIRIYRADLDQDTLK